MIFVSLTRLRIRSIRFMPQFAVYAVLSRNQVVRSPGCLSLALLPDRRWTFWTMTGWENEQSMRAYMTSGAHKQAMPHLLDWCDEASVAHWTQPELDLPFWDEADRRMRTTGRTSKVWHPSPGHEDLRYDPPDSSRAAYLWRKRGIQS